MKEFSAQTGGRYVYVDDMLNLQELALAFGELFGECDNFIVSGCQVSGNSISAGYIYLNGKLRKFSGATGISSWPQYLYENNQTESVQYAVGGTKVGRNVYGVSIGATVPTTLDPLTQKIPVSMQITQNGGKRMKDAFFGRYALILDSATQVQSIRGSVKLGGDLEVSGSIKGINSRYVLENSSVKFETYSASGVLSIESVFPSNNRYKFSMEDDSGFAFYVNNTLAAKITSTGIVSNNTVQSTIGIFGNVGMSTNNLYNRTELSNAAALNINMIGYGGASGYYRDTKIGNGKGTAIVTVNGQSNSVLINGVTTFASNDNEGIILLSNKIKSNASLQKSIIWKDVNKEVIGFAGFSESTDLTFRITNNLAAIYIYGPSGSFVDLGPSIKEGGQLLSDKYVLKSSYNNDMSNKVGSQDVYTKVESDKRYGKITDGFTSFANSVGAATLRTQIGAIGSNDLSKYALLSNYLSDMAKSETDKKKIRDNIGAAAVSDFQAKMKDTGWILIKSGLYIRQIGNVVCIQGTISTIHSGTLFNIPNSVDPPTHAVYKAFVFSNSLSWSVAIKGGSRQCTVKYCNGSCYKTTEFSITYMV